MLDYKCHCPLHGLYYYYYMTSAPATTTPQTLGRAQQAELNTCLHAYSGREFRTSLSWKRPAEVFPSPATSLDGTDEVYNGFRAPIPPHTGVKGYPTIAWPGSWPSLRIPGDLPLV
ncbi:hypothetical protein BaRGS_00039289, partial [Batillaria attramentaria]